MKLVERRIGLLFAVFLIAFIAIVVKAVYLNTVEAGSLKKMAIGQQEAQLLIPAKRGQIFDRNGEIVATNEEATTVFATPYQVKDPAQAAQKIAPLLGTTAEELMPKLADDKKGFVYLSRQMDPWRADQIKKLKIEGIEFIDEPKRQYPNGPLAGQVIGAVGVDRKGLLGIEYMLERKLHGEDGRQHQVNDARGKPISLVETRRMQPGEDITLTIDSVLQSRVESVLERTAEEQQAKSATAIVMRPDGEVLAMASWPKIDPNDSTTFEGNAITNLATGFLFEPGSIMKPFTMSAALESGKVTPETIINAPSSLQVYDRVIQNAGGESGCSCPVSEVLAKSINTGTAIVGQMTGPEAFDEYVRKFGFSKPTGIDFPGEETGFVLKPEEYSGVSLVNMAIGQGLSMTPMQVVRAYAAIANGGTLIRPRLVRSVAGQEVRSPRGKPVISAKTASQVRQMMKGVVSEGGTAEQAEIPGYEIAGKTGTAQKFMNGAYSDSLYVASFAGIAPAGRPELIALVSVDEPTGQYGGLVSAPAFEQIMSFALPYLGIAPG